MSVNEGFVIIIRVLDGEISYYPVINGVVDYAPEIAWKIEKESAFNPEIIIRKHSYHRDKIDVEVIFNSSQYYEMIDFISNADQLYIEFFAAGDIKKQYPISIDKLPKLDDDGRRYLSRYKFQFLSIYTIYNMLPFEYAVGYGNNYGSLWGF
ncbi:MAG: hypothetical protein WC965_11780 [Thiohalomonadaceae bacterium]